MHILHYHTKTVTRLLSAFLLAISVSMLQYHIKGISIYTHDINKKGNLKLFPQDPTASCIPKQVLALYKKQMWGWNNPLPMGQSAQSCPGVVENRLA